jgi:HEPN domain-containing protein
VQDAQLSINCDRALQPPGVVERHSAHPRRQATRLIALTESGEYPQGVYVGAQVSGLMIRASLRAAAGPMVVHSCLSPS